MKKRIFALALAVCMMVSVMPTSFATGILTVDGGSSTTPSGILTVDNGTSTRSTTTSTTQTQQSGILYNTSGSGTTLAGDTTDEEETVDTSGALDSGETATASGTDGIYTKLENTGNSTVSADLSTDASNKLELSKNVSAAGDKITLEAYVTGKQVTSSVSSAAPMDVILILDTSREMGKKTYTFTEYKGEKGFFDLRSQIASAEGLYYKVGDAYYPVTSELTYWTFLVFFEYTFYYTDANGSKHVIEKLDNRFATPSVSDSTSKTYYTISGTTYSQDEQKLLDLKTAANKFIDLLAAGDTNQRRVALLTYDNTTDILSGSATATDGALVNAKSNAAMLKGIIDTISVDTTKAAYCNTALNAAKQIFQDGNATVPTNRPRVVILLSAGIFGPSGSLDDTNTDGYVAMDMIWLSTILKTDRVNENNTVVNAEVDFSSSFYGYADNGDNDGAAFKQAYGSNFNGCGATVYCVGIGMPNTDETVVNGRISDEGTAESLAARINEVMYRVSSHRPDGTHVQSGTKYNSWENVLDENGDSVDWAYHYWDTFTRNHPNGYFLTVNNTDDLDDIFETISEDIITGGSGNSTLTTATVVKDVVSDYFVIPKNAGGTYSINVYTAKYKGSDDSNITANDWETPVAFADADIDCDGKTVTVTNFSFTDNWVGSSSGTPHGYKLIIEIPISPKTGFLGGQNIPTNDDANAGIYLDGTLVENFPATGAKTNVEIPAITVDVQNKNVYLSNEMTVAEMLSDAVVKIGDTTLNLKAENFGLAAWQYAYLSKIEVASAESDGSFKATCTVTDKAANTKSGDDSANVSVFKPHITFKDSTIYLGEKADYTKNYGATLVEWKNGTTSADSVTMTGTKPSVDVEYSPVAAKFTECKDVSVTTVKLNNIGDYMEDTTFWNGGKETGSVQFTVHVLKPVVEFQDSTIYLGHVPATDNSEFETYNIKKNPTDSSKHLVTWAHTKDDGTYTEDYDYPDVTFEFDAKGADYTDCAPISAKVYSGGLESHTGSFTVHVLKPSFSVQDGYIYQGQSQNLVNCINLDDWTDDGCEENDNIVGNPSSKISFAFTFTDITAYTAFKPETCTPVELTGASINSKSVKDFVAKHFTVHVLKPHFTVTTNDLWADYGKSVDLYGDIAEEDAVYTNSKTDAVNNVQYNWVYTGDCSDDDVHPDELPSGEPIITVDEVTFTQGGTHPMDAVDAAVTVKGVKYTNKPYPTVAGVAKETETDLTVTYVDDKGYVALFVNKFDLTISKSWKDGDKAADRTYKQDAIFTVEHEKLGSFQVVLPAGQSSIEVTGLLCGQNYKVEEQTNWTWRWKANVSGDEENATIDSEDCGSHDVSVSNPHDTTEGKTNPTARGEKTATFINSLFNRLWLSFCAVIENIFQKGGN